MKLKRSASGTQIKLVSERVMAMANAGGPGAKLPTVDEMCVSLDTSRTTLNDALRNLEERNFICRRQGSGIFVSPKIHQKMILVLLDGRFFYERSASPFWGFLWGSLARVAQERSEVLNEVHRFHLVTTHSSPMHELSSDTLQWIERGAPDCVIDIGLHDDARVQIEALGIPCVAFAAFGIPMIQFDTAFAIALGVEHLARQGCRRLALWQPADALADLGPATTVYREEERRRFQDLYGPDYVDYVLEGEVFQDELRRRQLTHDPELMFDSKSPAMPSPFREGSLQEQSDWLVRQVFGRERALWPDGVFIMDDLITDVALCRMLKLGIEPGIDVKIVSYGNRGSNVLYVHNESITVLEFDPEEVARKLFQVADVLMSGEPLDKNLILVRPRLSEAPGITDNRPCE